MEGVEKLSEGCKKAVWCVWSSCLKVWDDCLKGCGETIW